MQARPTTEQILNDLAREVRDTLIPGCDDPAMVEPPDDGTAPHRSRRSFRP